MLYRITQSIVALAALAGLSTQTWAASPADYPWTVAVSGSVSTVPWSKADIGSFLTRIRQDDEATVVADYRFVDLLGDGGLELVATVDINGRAFFNELVIVRRSGALFATQSLATWFLEQLSGVVSDIDHDGKQELLIPVSLTPYISGPTPVATWTAIYAWNGSLFQESTAHFSNYVTSTVLPPLQAAVQAATKSGDPQKIALVQIQLDKEVRASGGEVTAGLSMAQELATSLSPTLRTWAASVLGDIGTPAALTTLTALTQDPDPSVALYAKAAQQGAAWAHCDRVGMVMKSGGPAHIVNLRSKEPIEVAVYINADGPEASEPKSITFGSTGLEPSLRSCDDEDHYARCHFSTNLSGLQVGDGVATLYGRRRNNTCFTAQTGVVVVDMPERDQHDHHDHEDNHDHDDNHLSSQ